MADRDFSEGFNGFTSPLSKQPPQNNQYANSDVPLDSADSDPGSNPNMDSYNRPKMTNAPFQTLLLSRADIEREEEEKIENSTLPEKVARWWSCFANEFWPTFFYAVLVLSARMTGSSLLIQSLTEGLLMVGLMSAWVKENAAHLDPMITIGLVFTGRLGLPWVYGLAHLLAQPCAVLLATLFVWEMTPGFERSLGLGAPILAPGYLPGQGLSAQILASTAIYSVFFLMVTSVGRNNYYTGADTETYFKTSTLFSMGVGFTHAAAALALGSISGTYYNWYLYFFPRAVSQTIDGNWWLYFVGQPGALFFALLILYGNRWLDGVAWPAGAENRKTVKTE